MIFAGGCGKSSAQPAVVAGENTARSPAVQSEPRFIAYYFHRTLRCPTCLAIERQSQETIAAHFKDALADGGLAWRPVNMETPEDRHFEKDFQLEAQALVLVEMSHGKVAHWKNLTKVWDLVDNPSEFQEYVRTEVVAFLSR